MQAIASYVRNIAVFIIFSSVLEIILPDNKFKEYINLVTGLILIYIMAAPLGNIINVLQMPSALTHSLDKSILQQEQAYYEEIQRELILEEYKRNIHLQLETIVGIYGTLIEANVTVSEDDIHFGEIESIEIVIAENDVKEKKPFIRIEKISVNKSDIEESEEIKKIKSALSDFYNLSVDNIHITVQKKDG